MSTRTPRETLYFIDPLTREYRSTPPTSDGHLISAWEGQLAAFIERWEARSADERQRLLDDAITADTESSAG